MKPYGGIIEESIFLIDTSNKMNKGNRYSQIQNGIVNSIINDKTFIVLVRRIKIGLL